MASVRRKNTLEERLKDPGYKYWLKAGMCLIHVKQGLETFVDAESKTMHLDILSRCVPCGQCTQDGLKQIKSKTLCPKCDSFKREIQRIYRYGRPNWDNTDVRNWHYDHWSVAKCFMNPGQSGINSASDTDISGLLNFIILCKRFQDPKYGDITTNAEKVRDGRNHLMHSRHDQLTEAELKSCTKDMLKLLKDVQQLKGSKETGIARDRIIEVVNENFLIILENEYITRLTALEGRIDLLKCELDETNEKLERAEENFEKGSTIQRQEIEKASEEVRDLKMKYDQMSQKLDKIQVDRGAVEKLKVDLQVHDILIRELDDRVKTKFTSVTTENKQIKHKFGELQIQVEDIKDTMKQHKDTIERHDSQLSYHETQLRVQWENIEQNKASQKDDMTIIKKKFGKSRKNVSSLKKDVEALKRRLFIMEKDLIPKVSGNNPVDVNDILPNTIQHGSVEAIQFLLQGGADINVRSQNGENLLHIACLHSRLDIVKLLHSKNANLVNEIDNDRRSVGPFAAAGGSVEVLEFLVSLGLDPYYKDPTGWNLLHYACFNANESLSQHITNKYPQLLYDRTEEGMSVLLCAAFGGNVSIFKNIYELIYNSIKRDQREHENGTKYSHNMMKTIGQQTLLHMSCLGRRREMTKYLVEMYPEMLSAVDNSNSTPAHEAAYSGSVSILRFLIDRGTDPSCRTSRKETLLHRACINGQIKMAKYLVETYPAMLHEVDNSGNTPAHNAAIKGDVALLCYLIDHHITPWCKTFKGETLLHRACINGQLEMTKYLTETYPEMLHIVDNFKRTPAHHAAVRGNVSVLKYLIEQGTYPWCRTSEEETLLHTACIEGELDMTKYLVGTYPKMLHDLDRNKYTPAHHAAVSGSVDVLSYLIDHCADPWCLTAEAETLLHIACLYGQLEIAKYLVKSYPKMLRMVDCSNSTPAHHAAGNGNVAVLRYIIDSGVDPWCRTSEQETLLHRSCIKGELEIIKYLVETYPKMLDERDKSQNTPAHYAAESGNVAVLTYLIDSDSDPWCTTSNKDTLLHRACLAGKLEMTSYLVKRYPTMILRFDRNQNTPAHKAAYSGNVSVLTFLIGHKADPWCRTLQEETLLHRACINGQLEMTKYLVETYPEMLHQVDKSKSTPAHNAAVSGNVDVLSYLIDRGTDPGCRSFKGETLLHHACNNGQLQMTRYIVEKYPNMIYMGDNSKNSPAHHAAHNGNVAILRYLIPRGTNPWRKTAEQQTLLHIACLSGQFEMIKYLIETFPKMLHEVDNSNRTPAHQAAKCGNVAVLKYLIDHGANPWCRTSKRETLLHIAYDHGKLEIIKYLTETYPEMQHVDKS